MSKKLTYWLPVILWMGIIYTLSSYHAVKSNDSYWLDFSFKKFAHMVEYGILWFLNYRALRHTTGWSKNRCRWIGILITVMYAVTDEYHQTWVPSREGRPRDVMIDTIGASVVFFVTKLHSDKNLGKV